MFYLLKKHKLLKKITAFIILVIFSITSCIPVHGVTYESINKSITPTLGYKSYLAENMNSGLIKAGELPLLLSYSIDKTKNSLFLAWNRDQYSEDNRFYVFKKGLHDSDYKLISDAKGDSSNYLRKKLDDNNGVSFLVCQLSKDFKIPAYLNSMDGIYLSRLMDYWKYSNINYLISNEVYMDLKDGITPLSPYFVSCERIKENIVLSWKGKDEDIQEYLVYRFEYGQNTPFYQFTTATGINDKASIDKDLVYYVWAFDKTGNAGTPLVFLKSGVKEEENNTISRDKLVSGVFSLNRDTNTIIEYQGLQIEVPAGAVLSESVLSVVPLDPSQLRTIPVGSQNITYGKGLFCGYNLNINGNGGKLHKDLKISVKYDETKLSSSKLKENITVNYYDMDLKQWQSYNSEEADLESNYITFTTNQSCQIFVGLMPTTNQNHFDNNYSQDFALNLRENIRRGNLGYKRFPVLLSYSIDKASDRLLLGWNRDEESNQSFFVFKKGLQDSEFKLISSAEGLTENYYSENLAENCGSSYLVCKIFGDGTLKDLTSSNVKLEQFLNYWRLHKNIYFVSNEVVIDLNDGIAPFPPSLARFEWNQKVFLAWEEKDKDIRDYLVFRLRPGTNQCSHQFTKNSSIEDKGYSQNNGLIYYVWAFDHSGNAGIPMVCYQPGKQNQSNSKNIQADLPQGIFLLNENDGTDINYKGVQLSIPAKAASADSIISIIPLNPGQMVNTPADAPNVTTNEGISTGYDITLNGNSLNRFYKDVQISLKYDETKLPAYTGEGSVFIYYFDEKLGEWLPLKRESIDTRRNVVICSTNHFCQFYTGLMTVASEPPQAKGINTEPKNIGKVDPMVGIRGIDPPVPNNQGTANISFPIPVPEGINQFTPVIAINYSSDVKEGNCGYGWSLGGSAITVDTKNGVPKYDGTDKLLFDGVELVHIGNRIYRFKVENQFYKIVKEGNSFVVYKPDGEKLYFGSNDNSRLFDPHNPGRTFLWYITKVVDKFNNEVNYEYEPVIENGQTVNLYLKKITYGYQNSYSVDFVWENSHVTRISYRSGFLIKNCKRLSSVLIKYRQNVTLKSYQLYYNNPSPLDKCLLLSIEERNGSGDTINQYNFNYSSETNGWSRAPYDPPMSFSDRSGKGDNGVRPCDVNGDGLTDLIWQDEGWNDGEKGVWLNNGNGWTKASYDPPLSFTDREGAGDNGIRIGDVNGDGLDDLIWHDEGWSDGEKGVWLNTGNGWTKATYDPPLSFTDRDGKGDNGVRLGDVNGDGLIDFLYHDEGWSDGEKGVWLNTGNGWTKASYDPPLSFTDRGGDGDNGVRLGDVNGDGLIDFLYHDEGWSDGEKGVWLNTGNGWIKAPYDPPLSFTDRGGKGNNGVVLGDVNGDGLIDFLYHDEGWSDGEKGVWLNTGNGWNRATFDPPLSFTDRGGDGDNFVWLGDVNGDGRIDFLWHDEGWTDGEKGVWINNGQDLKLCSVIHLQTRVVINMTYKRIYLDPNHNLTLNCRQKDVLSSISVGRPDLLMMTTNISYENGIYDLIEREFRGFEKLTVSNPDNEKTWVTNIKEATYKVNDKTGDGKYDPYLKGQINTSTQKMIVYNKEIILSREKYIYDKIDILYGQSMVKFVLQKEKRSWFYNKSVTDNSFLGIDEINGDLVDKTEYVFDNSNGIPQQSTVISYGDPHHPCDDIKKVTDYAVNIWYWLFTAYKTETIDLKNNQRISLETLDFDHSSEGIISRGIISAKKEWNNNGNDLIVQFEFDQYGNKTKMIQPDGLVTNYQTNYFTSGDIVQENIRIGPYGLKEIIRYDMNGRMVENVDINNDLTKFYYDNNGRLTKVIGPQDTVYTPGQEISYQKTGDYFQANLKCKDESSDGYIRFQFFKDALGREIQTKQEGTVEGRRVWIVSGKPEYDKMGRVISTGSISTVDYFHEGFVDTDLIAPVTNYIYDDFGVRTRVEAQSGLVIENQYDAIVDNYYSFIGESERYEGKRILIKTVATDNLGHKSCSYKDLSGKLVKSETLKDNGEYVTFQYDANLSGLAKIKEPTGEIGEKAYDSLDRLMWTISPDAGKMVYHYNDKGLIEKVIDYGKNQFDDNIGVVNYVYDEWNRISMVDYSGLNNDIRYEYYGIGDEVPRYARGGIRMISKGSYFNIGYEYDQYTIKETKTIDGDFYTTVYEYDRQDRIKALTYPDGETVRYYYDDGGRLNRIEGQTVYVAAIYYDAYGQRSYLKYGNGSEMTYQYDSTTRLLDRFKAKENSGAAFLDYQYQFDILGNLTEITDYGDGSLKSSQKYRYDFLGRITAADGLYPSKSSDYHEEYSYDDVGRMIQKTYSSGRMDRFKYLADSHAISTVEISNGEDGKTAINFSYDDFGNLVQKKVFAGTAEVEATEYKYDQENRLSRITNGLVELEFRYDHGGQRINKMIFDDAGVIKKTVYVNGFYTLSDGRVDKHISDGKYIIATKIVNELDKIRYYHSNHIGSTAALSDSNGQKTQSYLYYPYGEIWVVENAEIDDEINRLFTGQEYDKESGLYYYNQRYYDPQLGIFINPDPAKDGINHYAYCLNNPIIYNDPTGEFVDPVTLGVIIGAICGAYQGYQIGQANGASGLESLGYTLGGAIVGGLAGYAGAYVASSGVPMANTLGIMASSSINSVGMYALSGGETDISISFGYGSYNFSTGELNYLSDGDNEWYEDLGYTFGAMANLSDTVSLFGGGTNVDAITQKNSPISHAAVVNEEENINVSVGPEGGNYFTKQNRNLIRDGASWPNHSDDGLIFPVNNVNKRILQYCTNQIKEGKNFIGLKLKYCAIGFSCVSYASRALWLCGIPNIGLHPYLWQASLVIRQTGIFASPYLASDNY